MSMSRVWSDESAVLRRVGVVWKRHESEVALLDPTSGRLGTLNEVAARCWELADGRTVSEIVGVLQSEFEVNRSDLEVDVRELLTKLDERGLLSKV